MRLSSILISILGLAVAGGSVFAARNYVELQQAQSVAATQAGIVQVIVASRDIPLGQPIEAAMLTTVAWPREALPADSFTEYEPLLGAPGGEPRRARRAITQGEVILAGKLSEFGEKVTIVQALEPGFRAVAIEVSAETAVGGFVTPGDRVDILLTSGTQETLRAVTILQNIRVMGVDQDSDENDNSVAVARTVTLEVSPSDGQRLALARRAGTLSLSLRTAALEGEVAPVLEAISLNDLLRVEAPVPVALEEGETPPPPPPVREIVVRRGTVETLVPLNP